MKFRTHILLTALLVLTACVATPRVEIPPTLSFNYVIPDQSPMSYADIMCCYDCRV